MQTHTQVVLSTLFLASIAPAQALVLGQSTGFNINVQALATANIGPVGATWGDRTVGACRDRNGNYWAVCGTPLTNPGAATTGKIIKFDSSGNFVRAIDQPIATTGFGIRDLAYDGNNTIYGGIEGTLSANRIKAFDIVTEAWVPALDWTAPALAVHRGLAYDPIGNSGRGSMWTSNFTANPLTEFDSTGAILRTIPVANLNGGTSIANVYGLAIDSLGRKLWAFSQGGSTKGPYGGLGAITDRVLIEVDLVTGLKTGLMSFSDLAGGAPIAGGVELSIKNGDLVAVCLNQGTNDSITEICVTFNYGSGCGGRIGMTGDAPWSGNAGWALTLSGSTAVSAIPMLSAGAANIPLPPGIAGPGCSLLVSPVNLFFLPTQNVIGGSATMSLPIPLGLVPGPIYFQWLEIPASVVPVTLSGGGGTVVGYN